MFFRELASSRFFCYRPGGQRRRIYNCLCTINYTVWVTDGGAKTLMDRTVQLSNCLGTRPIEGRIVLWRQHWKTMGNYSLKTLTPLFHSRQKVKPAVGICHAMISTMCNMLQRPRGMSHLVPLLALPKRCFTKVPFGLSGSSDSITELVVFLPHLFFRPSTSCILMLESVPRLLNTLRLRFALRLRLPCSFP